MKLSIPSVEELQKQVEKLERGTRKLLKIVIPVITLILVSLFVYTFISTFKHFKESWGIDLYLFSLTTLFSFYSYKILTFKEK